MIALSSVDPASDQRGLEIADFPALSEITSFSIMALEIAIQGDINREYGVFKKFDGATDCLGIIVCDNTFYLVVRLFLDFTSIRGPYATILESDEPTRSVVGVMVSQFPRRNVAIRLASQGGSDCIQIIVYIGKCVIFLFSPEVINTYTHTHSLITCFHRGQGQRDTAYAR